MSDFKRNRWPESTGTSGRIRRNAQLLADGLVDELHLFVYPVTRGTGPRLFTEDIGAATWSLASSATYDNSVVYLHYSR